MKNKSWNQYFSLGDVYREGAVVLGSKLGLVILFSLTIHIPLILFRTLFPTERYSEMNILWLSFGVDTLNSILILFVLIGIAHIVESFIQGKHPTFVNIFKFCLSRFLDVTVTNIYLFATLFLFFLLLIFPAIYYGNYFSFSILVCALRTLRGKAALDYSKKLVQGNWWKVFGVHFALGTFGLVLNIPFLLISRNFADIAILKTFLPNTANVVIYSVYSVYSVIFFLNFDHVYNHRHKN